MELAPLEPGKVRIFLTRHGKTFFNQAHKAQGWTDAPLTPEGAAGAEALGRGLGRRGLRFASAWAGELTRQRGTARLILDAMGQEDLPIETENGLREVCFGRWDGEPEADRDRAFLEYLGFPADSDPRQVFSRGMRTLCDCYVGTDNTGMAETYETICARIPAALERIARTAEARGGGNVLAVTSGMISMCLFFEVMKIPREQSPHGMPNTGVSILEWDGEKLTVVPPLGRTDFAE